MSASGKRKRLGQHFLVDTQVIDEILMLIRPQINQTLVEIGPGRGALTRHLVRSPAEMHAIEIDPGLVQGLQKQYSPNALTIHHADALKFDYSSVKREDQGLRIVGNLPYSISTPLMLHLIKFTDIIEDMCFMVQYEVAERLTAKCGTSSYGRLTVCVTRAFEVETVFHVEPDAFSPPPEVRSSVIVMRPKPMLALDSDSERIFFELIRLAFGKRRKTLRNSLNGVIDATMFQETGIDAGLRAENLSVENYVELAKCAVARDSECKPKVLTQHD